MYMYFVWRTIVKTSLVPDHSLARDSDMCQGEGLAFRVTFLGSDVISNQIRKNAIKLSHDSTSQRRLVVLELCHFKNYASRQWLT